MSNAIIAQRYAKAFLDIALEKQCVEDFQRDLESFGAAWDSSEELRTVLPAGDVSLSQRQSLIDAIADALQCHDMSKTFLKVLLDKRRINIFPYVLLSFKKFVAEHAGQVTAHVTTASPIHDAAAITAIQEAVARLKNKKVHIDAQVDPDVLGGVMIRVGDEIFDGTIAAELRRMRQNLLAVEV